MVLSQQFCFGICIDSTIFDIAHHWNKMLTGECRVQCSAERESAEETDFRTSLALPIGSWAGWQLGKGCAIQKMTSFYSSIEDIEEIYKLIVSLVTN